MSSYKDFKKKEDDEKRVILAELNTTKSSREIAKLVGISPTSVIREIKRLGLTVCSKSEAQKRALASGASVHPTKGKKRTAEVKKQIGVTRAASYHSLSDAEKENFADKARQNWLSLTPEKRQVIQHKGQLAIREASRHGSKLEKYLYQKLIENNYVVDYHREHLIRNENLHLDMLLPKINVAIEIDGPSHFIPIWGDEALERTQKADKEKNALLLQKGISVIRIRHFQKSLSNVYKEKILSGLLDTLVNLNGNKQPKVIVL